jgi:hypothetical protein
MEDPGAADTEVAESVMLAAAAGMAEAKTNKQPRPKLNRQDRLRREFIEFVMESP